MFETRIRCLTWSSALSRMRSRSCKPAASQIHPFGSADYDRRDRHRLPLSGRHHLARTKHDLDLPRPSLRDPAPPPPTQRRKRASPPCTAELLVRRLGLGHVARPRRHASRHSLGHLPAPAVARARISARLRGGVGRCAARGRKRRAPRARRTVQESCSPGGRTTGLEVGMSECRRGGVVRVRPEGRVCFYLVEAEAAACDWSWGRERGEGDE